MNYNNYHQTTECNCQCHTNKYYMHSVPCCEICPNCDGKFTILFKENIEKCKQRKIEFFKQLQNKGL